MRARLCGFGFWTPGYADLAAWAAGAEPDPRASQPDASILPSRLRRRTALLTRMGCDVLTQAARHGDADLSRARMVLSSAWGEFETTAALLLQLVEPQPQVSPTLFHNSVHNSTTGYLSIAVENQAASTAIGAGRGSLRVGLIEAMTEVVVDGGEVLLAVADEHIPSLFVDPPGHGIAVGLCLRPLEAPVRGGLDITLTLRHGDYEGIAIVDPLEIPAQLVDNPSSAALPLARAVAAGEPCQLRLDDGDRGWILELSEARTP